MSAAADFYALREWTPDRLDEFLAEPRDFDLDWRRFEILDGALLMSPPPLPRHELVAAKLIAALAPAVPDDHHVIGAAGLTLGRSYRVTDVTVLPAHVFAAADWLVGPADVLLAIEIESPSSITTDRVTKPAQYAAAGITHYWRAETDPIRLVTYRLADGLYVETGSWGTGDLAKIVEPFRVNLDVTSLQF